MKKRKRWLIGVVLVLATVVVIWLVTPSQSSFKQATTWQRLAEPGQLSAAHAHLENDCGACHTSVTGVETAKCIACHANADRHFKLFGQDCAQCHATDRWTIPEYRHPPTNSMDCAQCHQAPPSHSMQHFNMISQEVAGRPHARVDQCFQCHQTTSWNDIQGAGWYKHH